MEIYLLITGIVTFIGVVCVVVYLEKTSRASAERFKKEREDNQLELQSLAAIYSMIEQTNGLLNKLDAAQQEQTSQMVSRLDALNSTTKHGIDELCRTQIEQGRILQITLQETSQATTKQIEAKLQETGKHIQALKTSLEESVKF